MVAWFYLISHMVMIFATAYFLYLSKDVKDFELEILLYIDMLVNICIFGLSGSLFLLFVYSFIAGMCLCKFKHRQMKSHLMYLALTVLYMLGMLLMYLERKHG